MIDFDGLEAGDKVQLRDEEGALYEAEVIEDEDDPECFGICLRMIVNSDYAEYEENDSDSIIDIVTGLTSTEDVEDAIDDALGIDWAWEDYD